MTPVERITGDKFIDTWIQYVNTAKMTAVVTHRDDIMNKKITEGIVSIDKRIVMCIETSQGMEYIDPTDIIEIKFDPDKYALYLLITDGV